MAYPMIHLCIAKKVAELNPQRICSLPQFYLGSIAPDAVHFRDDFNPEYKKSSHLCVSDEKWGLVSDTDKWIEDVLIFLKNNRRSKDVDFIYGYCTHVLADIRNAIDFWIPFKLKLQNTLNSIEVDESFLKARQESRLDEINADNRLYKDVFQGEMECILHDSIGVEIRGVITEEEVNKIRDNILYIQYKDISYDDTYMSKFVTYEEYLDFIDRSAKIISSLIWMAG